MSPRRVDALAHIRLLSTELGGRRSSTLDRKWRCRLKVGERCYEVLLVNDLNEAFAPGAAATAELTFLDESRLADFDLQRHNAELWEIGRVGEGYIDLKRSDEDARRFA